MVEAPRIRRFCETIKPFCGNKIINAIGTSYNKLNVNLVKGIINDIWFYGKHLFLSIKVKKLNYLIKIHFMMYGRVVVNGNHPKPHIKTPNFQLVLENNNTLSWYFSQIKLVDETYLGLSKKMIYYDVSHLQFDKQKLLDHISNNKKTLSNLVLVDFLLDQDIFPGVGNMLQQEALYACKILPTRIVNTLTKNEISCLIDALHVLAIELYKSDIAEKSYYERHSILVIYHKAYCLLKHKTITKYLGIRERRTTWCPICQL